MLLEVKNLQTQFRTDKGVVQAVKGVSFTLKKGETLGIVGESGSGKSVTSLSMMRLIPQPPGEIVGGEVWYERENQEKVNLLNLSEEEMRAYRGNDLAMIFQEPMTSLNPVFTCGEQILEAILLHQDIDKVVAKRQVLHLFEKVQLPNPKRIYRSYPHELSGGQKQRVMIAMALSCNPSVLIADEPTTALDVSVQKAILELMVDLQKEMEAGVIFITHDLGVIAEIADQVLVMFKGEIVEAGTVEEIFNHPKHPYTKGLLACRPPLDYRVSRLPVISDFMDMNEQADGSFSIEEKAININELITKNKISTDVFTTRLEELQAQEPILKVKGLKTWFPSKTNIFGKVEEYVKAVDGVSFDVYPGETLGLVGESGCGKTTLGRSILRLAPVRSGEIWFENKNLLTFTQRALKPLRKDLQIIFQDPYSSLNPRMTIGNAILEPLKVHGLLANDNQRKEKAIDLLETVNLSADHFMRYPHEFSGGQRQRVCIARALALKPRFLICDESVSALDVSVQAQVLNLLLDLRERLNLTYIFISHDLSVVKLMSDRIAVMNQGKIEEIGAAERVFHHPESAYTKRLIEAIPRG